MYKACLTLVLTLISFSSIAQTNTIFGLQFTSGELRMAQADIISGEVTVLNDSPLSADGFQSGVADFDPFNKYYFYIQNGRLRTVDGWSGAVVYNVPLEQSPDIVEPITNIAYHWMDDRLYGVQHRSVGQQTQLWLVAADPSTGEIEVISPEPISVSPYLSGNSDLDVANREYIYATPLAIYRVDLDSGEVISEAVIQDVFEDGSESFVNLAFNWADGQIYGLHFYSSPVYDPFGPDCQGELRLASIDPIEGTVQIISSSPVSPDCFSMGDSDIDVNGNRFVYLRSGRAYSVDLDSGALVESTFLENPNNAIASMINMTYDDFVQMPQEPIAMDMGGELNMTGSSMILNAWNGDNVDYLWSTGETSPSIEVNEEGTYSVTLEREGVIITGEVSVISAPLNVLETDESGFNLFPVPAVDQIQLDFEENREFILGNIYDISGRWIESISISGTSRQIMQVGHLSAGRYVLELRTQGGESAQRSFQIIR